MLDVLYGGGDYSGGSREIAQARDVAVNIGCPRRPLSQPLYTRLGRKESVYVYREGFLIYLQSWTPGHGSHDRRGLLMAVASSGPGVGPSRLPAGPLA